MENLIKNKRNSSLDGLRFLAITLVVASHSGLLIQGGLGNNIFFSLSGFLSIEPFKNTNYIENYGVKGIFIYYLKRFLRIIPVFWFYLLFTSLLFPDVYFKFNDFFTESSFVLNMFFIKSSGHLWFLQQEIVFYIISPFILLIINLIMKLLKKIKLSNVKCYSICTILLAILTFCVIKFMPQSFLKLYGNGKYQPFRLGLFLLGMTTGYVYKTYVKKDMQLDTKKWYRALSNIILILFILFCIVSSQQFLTIFNKDYREYTIGWQEPELCTVLACITIFFLVTAPNAIVTKFFGNKFFTYIAKISFCMYLFHWPLLKLKNPYIISSFVIIYFVTICVSIIINKYIEKPCINLSKKIVI